MSTKVRRDSVHPDYLSVQLQYFQSPGEASEVDSLVKGPLDSGKYRASNDPQLHCIARQIYSEDIARRVRKIEINNCPIRYLGCRETEDEQVLKTYTISPLYNLTHLVVTECKLSFLPYGLGDLGALKVINVAKNFLHSLPEDVAEGVSLEELDVSCNLLDTKLPRSLLESSSLKILKLDDNELRPEHFPTPKELDEALLALQELKIDETIMKARGNMPPYPLMQSDEGHSQGVVTFLPEKEHTPILVKQSKSSRFSLLPVKGDGAVKFDPRISVWYQWESEVPSVYTDEFVSRPLEIVVQSLDHLIALIKTSEKAQASGRKGPLAKVAQILIQNDSRAKDYLPYIKWAESARAIVFKNCDIQELPDDFFEGMHSLKYVDFSANEILRIPTSFTDHQMIRTAIFDDNLIVVFPKIPTNLVCLKLNQNCLCVDNGSSEIFNGIANFHFSTAGCLQQLEMVNNPILPSDFLEDDMVTHLRLRKFMCDRKAVISTAKQDWKIPMEDGRVPEFNFKADENWLERVKKTNIGKIFGSGILGKQRFAKEATTS